MAFRGTPVSGEKLPSLIPIRPGVRADVPIPCETDYRVDSFFVKRFPVISVAFVKKISICRQDYFFTPRVNF